ncbi:hypothetical protein [Streptomyces sp. NPDC048349]|uniref:hypothetical protein n=1 Tax=Streptomyces sp. NPDC048349 TaxID=3155486 RepID=UPI00343F5702
MQNAPSEPELPDRVPEKRNAVTPDLPPLDPGAPDLPDAAAERPRRDGPAPDKEGTQPAAGPGNVRPQEPTD